MFRLYRISPGVKSERWEIPNRVPMAFIGCVDVPLIQAVTDKLGSFAEGDLALVVPDEPGAEGVGWCKRVEVRSVPVPVIVTEQRKFLAGHDATE